MTNRKSNKGAQTQSLTPEQFRLACNDYLREHGCGMELEVVLSHPGDGSEPFPVLQWVREGILTASGPWTRLPKNGSVERCCDKLIRALAIAINDQYLDALNNSIKAVSANDRDTLMDNLEQMYLLGCENQELHGLRCQLPRMGAHAQQVIDKTGSVAFYRLCSPQELYSCRRDDAAYEQHIGTPN